MLRDLSLYILGSIPFKYGKMIPSSYGIIPLVLREKVNIFFDNVTIVKMSKNYIAGLIIKIPLRKGKLPVWLQKTSWRDANHSLTGKAVHPRNLTGSFQD